MALVPKLLVVDFASTASGGMAPITSAGLDLLWDEVEVDWLPLGGVAADTVRLTVTERLGARPPPW